MLINHQEADAIVATFIVHIDYGYADKIIPMTFLIDDYSCRVISKATTTC